MLAADTAEAATIPHASAAHISRGAGMSERLPVLGIDTERAEQPGAHLAGFLHALGGIGTERDLAARDLVVPAGRLGAEHPLEQIAGVRVAVRRPDRAVEAAVVRTDRRRPFGAVEPQEEVR